jgi:hypothetical protein
MNTVMRKAIENVVRGVVAAAVLVGATQVNAAECDTNKVAMIGHMEVVATVERVADLGSMTVTARRETALADRSTSVESTGEATETRTRSPRAVLVQ